MDGQQGCLRRARQTLSGLARELDPWALPLSDAKAALGEVVAVKNIAATIEGRLARRIADAKEWERAGFPSAEAWLAKQTGAPLGRARDTLDTAERLEELPEVTEAANAGDLSPEQTAAISDAATADPSAERRLVGSARVKPLSRLRDECAAVKRAADPDPEAAHRRLHAARQLRFSRALDGAAKLFGTTTPEQMAVIKAAVERRGDELFDQARHAGRREPREAYLMDALAQICDEWLRGQALDLPVEPATPTEAPDTDRHTTQPAGPHSDGPAEPQARPKPIDAAKGRVAPGTKGPKQVPPGYLGILRVDVEALQRGHVGGDETCEIAGLGPVSVSVARRLLGDAVLKLVLTRGVDVVNVTHLGRGPTVAQKIAKLWGSPGCVVTGCARMAGIEHDHRIDWAHTHHTRVDELDRLCDHHHDLKTHRGWALVTGPDGTVDMVPPQDPHHPDHTGHNSRPDRHDRPRRAGPDPRTDPPGHPDPPAGDPPTANSPSSPLFVS